MKVKSKQSLEKTGIRRDQLRVVSEELDKMQDEMQTSLNNGITDENRKSQVKLVRSRRETRITLVFKGGLEETEDRLQRVYKAITS
jgi:hypothetical protein